MIYIIQYKKGVVACPHVAVLVNTADARGLWNEIVEQDFLCAFFAYTKGLFFISLYQIIKKEAYVWNRKRIFTG